MEIHFKQKLSWRTQVALVELLGLVQDQLRFEGDTTTQWTGEIVLSYNNERRYPRLVISAGDRWWTNDPELGLVADEDVTVLLRG